VEVWPSAGSWTGLAGGHYLTVVGPLRCRKW